MVEVTWSAFRIGARGTKETPSAQLSSTSAATCSAKRVLPTPPTPVSVSRRTSGRFSKALATSSSCSRPINVVTCMGKLFLKLAAVRCREEGTDTVLCITMLLELSTSRESLIQYTQHRYRVSQVPADALLGEWIALFGIPGRVRSRLQGRAFRCVMRQSDTIFTIISQ